MAWSDFVKRIEDEAVAIKDKVVQVAEDIGTIVVQEGEAALEELVPFAFEAVIKEAPNVIAGEKFGNAVTHVVQSVEAQGKGKTVGIAKAQLAVQAAYEKLKEDLTLSKAPPATT